MAGLARMAGLTMAVCDNVPELGVRIPLGQPRFRLTSPETTALSPDSAELALIPLHLAPVPPDYPRK
eukprot:660786-Rhodomonas_salina.1